MKNIDEIALDNLERVLASKGEKAYAVIFLEIGVATDEDVIDLDLLRDLVALAKRYETSVDKAYSRGWQDGYDDAIDEEDRIFNKT